MFGPADDFADSRDEKSGLSAVAPARKEAAVPVVLVPGGRYGERKRISVPAASCVVAIHLALLSGLVLSKTEVLRKEEHRLKVIEVQLTPPPAKKQPQPPKAPTPRPVAKAQMPPPLLQLTAAAAPVLEVTPKFEPPAPPPAPAVAPAPPAPSLVQGGNLGAQMVSGNPPRYPIESRRRREQGTVVLALTVGTDGRVQVIAIARSSGSSRLDEAARLAVKSWRWAPLVRNGQAVLVRGVVEIPFVLQESGSRQGRGERNGAEQDSQV